MVTINILIKSILGCFLNVSEKKVHTKDGGRGSDRVSKFLFFIYIYYSE